MQRCCLYVIYIECGSGNIVNEISYGMKAYFKTPSLRSLLVIYIGIAIASSMVIVNTVIYVKDYLGESDSSLALLFAFSGLGSMLMAFLYPKLANIIKQLKALKI